MDKAVLSPSPAEDFTVKPWCLPFYKARRSPNPSNPVWLAVLETAIFTRARPYGPRDIGGSEPVGAIGITGRGHQATLIILPRFSSLGLAAK